jgi:hypothetical protein
VIQVVVVFEATIVEHMKNLLAGCRHWIVDLRVNQNKITAEIGELGYKITK